MSRARKAPKTVKPVAEVDALTMLNPNAAGIDIGMDEMWSRCGRTETRNLCRRFGMNTPDLIRCSRVAEGV